MSAGSYIEFERVADYWGADLPVSRGLNNFDVIRYEFYRDRTAAFEAFKKGAITFRQEFTSRIWATDYNFPALTSGHVIKTDVPDEAPAGPGLVLQYAAAEIRRSRIREALGLAFDFEWTNKNIMFSLYERTSSFFESSESPLPDRRRRLSWRCWSRFRASAGGSLRRALVPPRSDGSGRDRKLLGEAARLLQEAGWERQGSRLLRNAVALTAEFLIFAPVFERALGVYVEALRSIGVEATIRLVDSAQYECASRIRFRSSPAPRLGGHRDKLPAEVFGEAVRAAGLRRLRPRPRHAAEGERASDRRRAASASGRRPARARRLAASPSSSSTTTRPSSRTTTPISPA